MSTERSRGLSGPERRTLAVLALPTLGLALATTVVTTYLPVVAAEFVSSTIVIGLIIGAEGLLALVLPVAAGVWSDQLRTGLGGRLPFILAATPVMAVALVLLGFVGGLASMAIVVLVFFGAYFVAYEPYRALYPDLVDDEIAGRSQSAQAVARGAGTGLALVGGGLLLAIGQPAPFATAAAILMVSTGSFAHMLLRRRGVPGGGGPGGKRVPDALRDLRDLVGRRPALRTFMAANALWELSLGALKTFVILYITVGLGFGLEAASGIIGGAALFVLAGAAISGSLGDRFGTRRVMAWAAAAYGAGLLAPFLTQSPALLIPVIPLIAFGGGVVMTLPYALLIPLMPEGEHGALTGLYSLSRGIGTMLGPLLGGVAIEVGRGSLAGTEGYAAMWIVCSAGMLASLPLLYRLGRFRSPGAG